jgi:hypothetical protein
MFAPCVKLQVLLGTEAMKRGRERHEEIRRKADVYFAKQENKS